LMQIAKKNLELFDAQVRSDQDKSEIPIDKIIKKINIIQCGVTKDAGNLKESINGILSDVANGRFLDGITKSVDAGLDMLLGNYAGNVSEFTSMTVSVGAIGGFYKIDYYMYSYQFTSAALTKITKNVVCVAIVISSIKTDSDNLNKNTVNVILQTAFGELTRPQLKRLQRDIYKELGWEPPKKQFPIEWKNQDQLKAAKWKQYDMLVQEEEEDDEKGN